MRAVFTTHSSLAIPSCVVSRGTRRNARENASSRVSKSAFSDGLFSYSYRSRKENSNNTRRKRLVRAERDGNYSPYHTQNEEKLMDLLTVQSVKTVLHYLQETNGEMHFYLNNYIYENPFGKTYKNSAGQPTRESGEERLINLASSGLTTVTNPMRGSVPTIEDSQPRTREISPRDVCERILATRKELSKDFLLLLEKVEVKNGSVLRNALEKTFTTMDEQQQEDDDE